MTQSSEQRKYYFIFGGIAVAAVVVAALYVLPISQLTAPKPKQIGLTADNFFKVRVGEEAPFFAEAKRGTEPYKYVWDFGDGSRSEEKSTNQIYTKEGRYLVTLTVTDADGDTQDVSHYVDVYPANANFTRGEDIRRK